MNKQQKMIFDLVDIAGQVYWEEDQGYDKVKLNKLKNLLNRRFNRVSRELEKGVEAIAALEAEQILNGQLRIALDKAVNKHGHEYNCSAVQGSQADCHCGWTDVKELLR
jgi:hypothetical protein